MSGIQVSVCNASYSKGMTYRLHNVPKYRTYPAYGEKSSMTYALEEFSRIHIMWRVDSSGASLSAVSAYVMRNPYSKGNTHICSI